LDSNNSVAIGAGIFANIRSSEPGPDALQLKLNQEPISVEELAQYRLPEPTLSALRELEVSFQQKDLNIRAFNDIRNVFEQFLYQYQDDVNNFSQIPSAEADSARAVIEEQQNLLYSDQIPRSLEEFETHFQSVKSDLQSKAPTLTTLRAEREQQRIQAEKEAAEAEANRVEVVRDKIKDPKTPKEKLLAAQKRKEQGNQFIK
jgi:hypothetical protein